MSPRELAMVLGIVVLTTIAVGQALRISLLRRQLADALAREESYRAPVILDPEDEGHPSVTFPRRHLRAVPREGVGVVGHYNRKPR